MLQALIEKIAGHAGWLDFKKNATDWGQFITNFGQRLINRGKIRQIRGTSLLLNLGCGNLGQEGWINIDRTTDSGIYYHDLRNLLPLESGCARHIHCEHFLEHLTYAYAKKLLKECYRMLEDGGTLRLIVPDAEKYLSAYCENNEEFFDQLKHLGGTAEAYKTKMEIINQMFRMDNDHNFAWDYATLELALKEAGFSTVQRSAKGETGAEYNIDGDDWWRTLESVYVNATK